MNLREFRAEQGRVHKMNRSSPEPSIHDAKCPRCGKPMVFHYREVHMINGETHEPMTQEQSEFGCFTPEGCGYYYDD